MQWKDTKNSTSQSRYIESILDVARWNKNLVVKEIQDSCTNSVSLVHSFTSFTCEYHPTKDCSTTLVCTQITL